MQNPQGIRVNKEQFDEWKQLPISKYFFSFLKREASVRRELASNGSCLGNSVLESGEMYTKMMTEGNVYELIPNVEFEDTLLEEEI